MKMPTKSMKHHVVMLMAVRHFPKNLNQPLKTMKHHCHFLTLLCSRCVNELQFDAAHRAWMQCVQTVNTKAVAHEQCVAQMAGRECQTDGNQNQMGGQQQGQFNQNQPLFNPNQPQFAQPQQFGQQRTFCEFGITRPASNYFFIAS